MEHSPQLYGFWAQFLFKKLDGHLPFFFLSWSNRNRGKAFAVLSKKLFGSDLNLNFEDLERVFNIICIVQIQLCVGIQIQLRVDAR